MSVQLNPSSTLGFNRPLTQLVKRTLSISNPHAQSVAFKVKTTAPKLYCVRPNSGKVEPGETVDVSVMLQPMKEEPPIAAKCKDKFLIQSIIITAEKEALTLAEVWATADGGEEKIHQQKLKVAYLPAEGQTLEEEDEGHMSSMLSVGDSRFDTVRQTPLPNGHAAEPIPEFTEQKPASTPPVEDAPKVITEHVPPPPPLPEPVPATTNDTPYDSKVPIKAEITPPPPPPRVPTPPASTTTSIPLFESQPVKPQPNTQQSGDLAAKYQEALMEIKRLRNEIAATSRPAELRRRNRSLADDGSTIIDSEVSTRIDDGPLQSEGVPLQVVMIIAIGVFVTTYLFF